MKWYVTTVIRTEDVLLVDPIASSKVIAIYDSVYNKYDLLTTFEKDPYKLAAWHLEQLKMMTECDSKTIIPMQYQRRLVTSKIQICKEEMKEYVKTVTVLDSETTVTNSPTEARSWIMARAMIEGHTVFGFDLEAEPISKRINSMQVSTDDKTLVYHGPTVDLY